MPRRDELIAELARDIAQEIGLRLSEADYALSPARAAKAVHKRESFIRDALNAGALPYSVLDGEIRITWPDLIAFVESQKPQRRLRRAV